MGAWALPLAAFAISGALAALLLRRHARSRHPALAVWTIALAMYATASFAMFLGVLSGWTTAEFRLYWLFGATLTVAYLATGEIYLLARRSVANAVLIVLLFGTAFAAAKIRTAPIHLAPLTDELPLGKDVFGSGTAAHRLPQLYSIPAYSVLLAGALWSAWRMRRERAARERALGTLGIAAGATIVAIGSGIGAGFGVVPLFSVGLAGGIAVMFWGFLRASRPVAAPGDARSSPGRA